MKKLGYIVSDRRILNVPNFIGVVNNVNMIDDPNIPFLVVGVEKAKNTFKKISFLNRKINNKQFWTFAKNERRNDYENDLKSFCETCINGCIGSLRYFYINPLKLSYKSIKKLISVVNNNTKKYIYISGSMIYLYYNNCVSGINLDILDYCGVSRNRVLNKMILKNRANIVKFNDTFLDSKLKASIVNKKYAVAYFMSME